MNDSPANPAATPWGDFAIAANAWRRWQVGPLTLWIQRLANEWRLAWQEETDETHPGALEVDEAAPEGPPETAFLERIASHRLGERLIVAPRLADRSVVVRPETSFRLAPQGVVDLYVGTPLWVFLETSEPAHRLLDVPTQRPSDSWFGPSTTEGELCYAGRTSARLQRDNLSRSPHRAVTRVRLRNRADDDLLLERLNLPVPNLGLFSDDGGQIWTQTVSVERGADGKLAEVRIEEQPPAEAEAAAQIAQPRVVIDRNVFSRALGALLS